ncbi:hypothetical protein Tco_0801844 [Tanacetum coccineum]|uniref:Reverse transcriptase domain-containing protein n=1 Tax=Tanacetum coccineum TaxID=301880 RepID=A0ABQ4ZZU9_9ASTR
MDWLSKRKFVIVCHEKVVRIPLEGDDILLFIVKRVVNDRKQLQVEFTHRFLVHGATPVAKSPYRLAPSEMKELSEQLQELQDEDVKDKILGTPCETSKKEGNERNLDGLRIGYALQYGVRGMILAAQSEAFKQENGMMRTVVMDKAHASRRYRVLRTLLDLSTVNILKRMDKVNIKVDKTLRFVEKPVKNSDREVKRVKCSRMVVVKGKLLAVRYLVKVSWNSKGNFELTWVWEDYLKDKLVKPLVLTFKSVVMYGLCVYMRYVDCVRIGNQFIERDRLIGIGLVMDLVKFLSFTFGGKEMTFVVLAFLR